MVQVEVLPYCSAARVAKGPAGVTLMGNSLAAMNSLSARVLECLSRVNRWRVNMSPDKTSEPLRIMLVEDSENECQAFIRGFQKSGILCEIVCFRRAEEALERLKTDASVFDLVVSDYKLPGISGLDLFRQYRALDIDLPFVILTGCGSEQLAVEALKAGVVDYLVKDSGNGYLELLPVQLREVVNKYRDRFARQQMEETLRNSERRLKDVINFLPDAIFAIDLEGKIIIWNRTAEEFTGAKAEDMIGKGDYEYAIPFYGVKRPLLIDLVLNSSEEIERLYPYIKREGDLVQGEAYTRNIRRGEAYMFGVAAPLYDSDGKIIGAIESVRDITERRHMEEELLKAQKLESVALLAGGIAHEFNNVLTSILGNISLAKLLSSPGDKIFLRLEAAEQASLRAKNLTKRLITFAHGGAPVMKLISLETLIRDSSNLALSGSRSLCEYVIPENLWQVNADEGQLSQVISNIVINADQTMPGGGKIIIRCENALVADLDALPLKNGRYVRIDIGDQGPGIPEESLGKIFDPYYTTKESGKGLGLTLAYSIIKKHDGHIAVKSESGVGSLFSIYLPASNAVTAPEKPDEQQTVSVNGRILVMDDEEIVRVVLGEMLIHLGYEVEVSANGREAIDMYSSAMQSGKPFDAVIMDLTIPGGMGGKEAVRFLREKYPHARVIVSSGYSNDPVMSDYKEYGFSGVVLKPYQVAELAKALKDVLAKQE